MGMLDRLEFVEQRFHEISQQLTSPEVLQDRHQLEKLSREHRELSLLVETYLRYKKTKADLADNLEILNSGDDPELAEIAKGEIQDLRNSISALEEDLKIMLLPKDPNDEKNVVLEIRAGTGGDEAGIFAGDLFRMYTRYAETRRWKVDILSVSEAPAGGFKEIIAMIAGERAFSRMKFERGVHRVQRVPATETQGRIHTSTVTVAVLPEAEEVEIEINEKDLRIDVYRSSGPGGQSVNTTDSAVRITHLPTGLVVAMQDEKSQHKNKDKAMRVLRARLLEREQEARDAERRDERRSQVGSGERAEKIRTYNYPQSRVTDHRINLTLYSLQAVIDGDLDQLVDPLTAHYQAEALKGEGGAAPA